MPLLAVLHPGPLSGAPQTGRCLIGAASPEQKVNRRAADGGQTGGRHRSAPAVAWCVEKFKARNFKTWPIRRLGRRRKAATIAVGSGHRIGLAREKETARFQ